VTTLVTGCAGFIGAALAASLLDDGVEVRGVDALTRSYDPALKRSALARLLADPAFRLDGRDLAHDDLAGMAEGCRVVFHLAAEPGVSDSWGSAFGRYAERNVVATQRLLEEVAARSPDAVFVYASSSSVYGEVGGAAGADRTLPRPRSPYGVTKLAAEHLCDAYALARGLPVVTLRYFSVYGPGQRPDMGLHRFCRAALTGEAVSLRGDGLQSRDFTYVTDVVAATRRAAVVPEARGRILDVGGGSTTTLAEVIDLIGEIAGSPLAARRVASAPGEVRAVRADPTAAAELLEWKPSVALREGLRRQLSWTQEMLESGVLSSAGRAGDGSAAARR
jgi:UDP-glucuronate 4-epimerase